MTPTYLREVGPRYGGLRQKAALEAAAGQENLEATSLQYSSTRMSQQYCIV